MIFMPPRHGKSELASRRFPAWFLGRNPERSIIAASYNSDLATDFGREVRDVAKSPLYRNVFRLGLSEDSQAANRWHTERGGGYVSAGVGTAVTGRGAHILLIDDPVKDRVDADSETIRERIWRWYTSTAYTRLEGEVSADVMDDDDLWRDFQAEIKSGSATPFEGAVVLIQTRWHEDDLAGRLLKAETEGGDKWEKLELPAINDAGEALWPQKYPLERLLRIKAAISTTSPRDWTALYQQRPTPEEGDYFKAEWLKTVDKHPPLEMLKIYGASDYAVTADGGDYTVHAVVGIDPDDRMYLLDLWRAQAASDKWVEAFCDLVKKWKPIGWAEETGQIKSGVGPFLVKQMIEKKAYVAREQFPTRGDKAIRAQSIRGRMAMSGLYMRADAPWRADLVSELLSFPVGVHDDQADALGLIGQLLDRMSKGKRPIEPKPYETPKGINDMTYDQIMKLQPAGQGRSRV